MTVFLPVSGCESRAWSKPRWSSIGHCARLGCRMARRMTGDLDAIVGKALRFEPEERYSSPAALSADIEHFLAGEPVSAARDSVIYQLEELLDSGLAQLADPRRHLPRESRVDLLESLGDSYTSFADQAGALKAYAKALEVTLLEEKVLRRRLLMKKAEAEIQSGHRVEAQLTLTGLLESPPSELMALLTGDPEDPLPWETASTP